MSGVRKYWSNLRALLTVSLFLPFYQLILFRCLSKLNFDLILKTETRNTKKKTVAIKLRVPDVNFPDP